MAYVGNEDLEALLQVSNVLPTGSYNHSSWKINPSSDMSSWQTQITSIHESLHHFLNQSTTYGLLISVSAHLASSGNETYKNILHQLLQHCRESHEIFATYGSLLVAAEYDSEILGSEWQKDKFEWPYTDYINIGKAITKEHGEHYIQFLNLCEIIRVSFQITEINHNPSVNDFIEALQHSPNKRRRLLMSKLTDNFWSQAKAEFVSSNEDKQQAEIFFREEKEFLEHYSNEELESIERRYSVFIHKSLAHLIDKEPLRYDAQLEMIEPIAAFGNSADNLGPINIPPLIPSQNILDEVTVSDFEAEAIYFKSTPLNVELLKDTPVSKESIEPFLYKHENIEYYYISSKSTEELFEKFSFSTTDADWLISNYPDTVTYLSINIDEKLLLLPFNKPEDLDIFDLESEIVLSSAPLLLFSDTSWTEWQLSLLKNSYPVVIWNLSPTVQFPRVLPQYKKINFDTIQIEYEDKTYNFLVLVSFDPKPLVSYIIPCSQFLSHLLHDRLEGMSNTVRLDHEAAQTQNLFTVLQYHLARLTDESHYDFEGLHSNYAERAFKENRFMSN